VRLEATEFCVVRVRFVEGVSGRVAVDFVEMAGLAHFDWGEVEEEGVPLIEAPRASDEVFLFGSLAFVLAAAVPELGKLVSETSASGEAVQTLASRYHR